jgi:Glycosyltransferase sugar-binding region containing DXD motif
MRRKMVPSTTTTPPRSGPPTSSSSANSTKKRTKGRRSATRHLLLLVLVVATLGVLFHYALTLQSHTGGRRSNARVESLLPKRNNRTLIDPSTSDIHNSNPQPQRYTAIPRILIFTHYRDLLNEHVTLTDEEEIVMASNIRKVVAVHNQNYSTPAIFLTDEQCIESLKRTYPTLIPHFQKEPQGMFKADICRGSALYETGGIYLDVDVGVRTDDLWKDLLPHTAFMTCRVHAQSHYPGHFFQAILGAAPQSPILYRYLQLFEQHYTGVARIQKGPLGVILLRQAWDHIYNTTTQEPFTELYQEVLYHKKLFPHLHPAPTWGTRRACHFVVVANANHGENAEFTWANDKHSTTHKEPRPYRIPLYSRIAGSRMCPTNHQHPHHPKIDEPMTTQVQ